jgi:RNA polymerase sigma-70 factor (ECF subfamily)
MSGDRDLAEEVTQETFLALLADEHRYACERGTLQGYLIGIARNRVRQLLSRVREFRPIPSWEPASTGTEMLEHLGREQELQSLRAAILSLPPNYREAVVLCDLEGLAYAHAASHLGCAVGTVRSRLHRARALLAAKLRKAERCPA